MRGKQISEQFMMAVANVTCCVSPGIRYSADINKLSSAL